MMNRTLAFVIALLACGIASAQEPVGLAWRVGDTWSYQQEDLWNRQVLGRTTLTVTGMRDASFVLRTEGGPLVVEELVAPDGTHDRPRVGIIDRFAHTPIRFPLKVGDSWSSSSLFQHYQGDIRKRELTCRAKRQESVKLAIGSFETVFVECAGTWVSLQGAGGRYELRLWYAPDVRWLVRAEERNWRAATGGSGLDMQVAHVLTGFAIGR